MKHIPNLLTLINATCGVVAIYFITAQSTNGVAACILLAALCDLLDGMVARKLGVQGALGKELDSLADAISFGAVPAFLWSSILSDYGTLAQPWAIILGGAVAASSIYRLAKFNLSTDQSIDFIGMPTPANALFALGLWIWLGRWEQWDWIVSMSTDERVVMTLILISMLSLSAYWLNSRMPILSFKSTDNNIRRIAQAMIVLLFCVLVIFVGPLAFTITVATLPLISLATVQLSNRKIN
jgi:CDP-diacylglycerol--serine O-phosphatidyltransferase